MLFSAPLNSNSFGSFPLALMVKSNRPGIWVCMRIGPQNPVSASLRPTFWLA